MGPRKHCYIGVYTCATWRMPLGGPSRSTCGGDEAFLSNDFDHLLLLILLLLLTFSVHFAL